MGQRHEDREAAALAARGVVNSGRQVHGIVAGAAGVQNCGGVAKCRLW